MHWQNTTYYESVPYRTLYVVFVSFACNVLSYSTKLPWRNARSVVRTAKEKRVLEKFPFLCDAVNFVGIILMAEKKEMKQFYTRNYKTIISFVTVFYFQVFQVVPYQNKNKNNLYWELFYKRILGPKRTKVSCSRSHSYRFLAIFWTFLFSWEKCLISLFHVFFFYTVG